MKEVTKAKAIKVPKDAPYFIEGKVYDVILEGRILFSVVDEDGEETFCCFDDECGHGISWERVYD